MNQTILVVGATGAQGGAVARHLLQRAKFSVRCLTRDPENHRAQALAEAGAEVVRGDLDEPESLAVALRNCHGVFAVTNYWEAFEREYLQGQNVVDAVARAGIGHLVFSTLPNAKRLSGGELDVPHFDFKARAEEYARESGVPATFVHYGCYYENFLSVFLPRRVDSGGFQFGFPLGEGSLGAISVEDAGAAVAAILEDREEYVGQTLSLVGDFQSGTRYADQMTRILGQRVFYATMSREDFAGLGFPGSEETADMFEYLRRFNPFSREDAKQTRALCSEVRSFAQWLEANRERALRDLGLD